MDQAKAPQPCRPHRALPSQAPVILKEGAATEPVHLGPYKMLERLGAGGMGEVWMAQRQTDFDGAAKVMALKLMAPGLSQRTDARRQFETEARISMMMSHSNIVQVFDVGESEQGCYLAMEWVDGVDLSTLIKTARLTGETLDVSLAVYIIGEVLNGLSYAHGLLEDGALETIIHRDISPHNILASVSGEVKITDFGIARLRSEETSGIHLRGKLRYMPPEQVAGYARTPATDLFAVGAVLYDLLSARGFRRDIPGEELFAQVAAGSVSSLERPDLPDELRELLDALLEPKVTQRVQSAAAALAMLRRWPGYASCRQELAHKVRELSGVEGPRSGLHIGAGTRPTFGGTRRAGGPRRTARELSGEDSDMSTLRDGSPWEPRPPSSPSLTWALAWMTLFGLGMSILGAMGTGWSLESLGRASAEGTRTQHDSGRSLAQVWVPEQPQIHGALTRDAPATEAPPAAAGEPPPRPEAGTLDSSGPGSEPTPGPKRARAAKERLRDAATERAAGPSSVRFTSGEFHWLTIEVGRERLSLDPQAKLSLEPGRYPVSLRAGGGEWQPAGTLAVEAGVDYRVDLISPGSFRQTATSASHGR